MNTQSVKEVERRTIKKTMWRLLPFILLLYIIAYLDRVNLGYAALEMNADLALSAEVFGLLSGIFFIGYFLFEVPSNMLLHKVGARFWIARIMITWGLVVVLTGFAQSAMHLYILRFLLGIAEAGFFPGIVLYLTYWFRKRERAIATSALVLALPLGGVIAGPLSTWIMDNIHWGGLAGWRWMFILEGIPAVLLGIVVLYYLTNRPKEARWLTIEERDWLEGELERERIESSKVHQTSKLAMLKESKVWKLSFIYLMNYTAMYGLSFWLPSIIQSLSENVTTNLEIGWLAMLPPLIGVPSILLFGWNASRTSSHKKHVIVSFAIAAAGYTACGLATSSAMMVFLMCLTAVGLYGFAGVFIAYMTFFFTESTAPVGIALVNSIASLGGFFGPVIFGYLTVQMGMFTLALFAVLAIVVLVTLKQYTKKGNPESNPAQSIS